MRLFTKNATRSKELSSSWFLVLADFENFWLFGFLKDLEQVDGYQTQKSTCDMEKND